MVQMGGGRGDVRRLVGDGIRSLRLSRGWTQERLAEASGLHRTYVTSLERGQRNASLHALCAVAEALEVPPSTLLRPLDPS